MKKLHFKANSDISCLFIPGVELVCETWDFACEEFRLLAPLMILRQGGWGEGWRELKLLSSFGLTFFLTSCGAEGGARGRLTQRQSKVLLSMKLYFFL
jgi:hypothetical protein